MSRPDAASITLNFNLPPEIIKEYFEGLAKVEATKRGPESDKKFDWSSLLAFAPLFVSILSSLSKSSESSKSVRVPEKYPESKEGAHSGSVRSSDVESENKPDIVISFVQKPVESAPVEVKMSVESCLEEKLENSEVNESDDNKSPAKEVKDQEENKLEEEKKTSTAKPRRPVYQDGDNVVLDLKDLTGTFSANGGAPLVDMMKMFGPMMEGLMGGMAGMNGPKADKPAESVSKQANVAEAAVSDESKEKKDSSSKIEHEE